MSEIRAVWSDAEQAGRHFAQTVRPFCHEQWKQGKRLAVHICEQEDERSVKQNAFMWAFVLKSIKVQAVIDGIGADENGWHLYFKRRLLGYRIVKTKVPGKKRPSITRELRSTTDLSVKRMSKYLDEVMAAAATEFGVTFEAGRRWEDWNA